MKLSKFVCTSKSNWLTLFVSNDGENWQWQQMDMDALFLERVARFLKVRFYVISPGEYVLS
jgi:hypothetical protein